MLFPIFFYSLGRVIPIFILFVTTVFWGDSRCALLLNDINLCVCNNRKCSAASSFLPWDGYEYCSAQGRFACFLDLRVVWPYLHGR